MDPLNVVPKSPSLWTCWTQFSPVQSLNFVFFYPFNQLAMTSLLVSLAWFKASSGLLISLSPLKLLFNHRASLTVLVDIPSTLQTTYPLPSKSYPWLIYYVLTIVLRSWLHFSWSQFSYQSKFQLVQNFCRKYVTDWLDFYFVSLLYELVEYVYWGHREDT